MSRRDKPRTVRIETGRPFGTTTEMVTP